MEMAVPLYGIRFISINDDFDRDKLRGDTGGINVAFKYLASELYSRDLSIKYESAKHVKFRRGGHRSRICPYVYRKGADGRMEPNEEAASNVRPIFGLAQAGHTPYEIATVLFERGIPTPGEVDILLIRITRPACDTDKVMRYWRPCPRPPHTAFEAVLVSAGFVRLTVLLTEHIALPVMNTGSGFRRPGRFPVPYPRSSSAGQWYDPPLGETPPEHSAFGMLWGRLLI